MLLSDINFGPSVNLQRLNRELFKMQTGKLHFYIRMPFFSHRMGKHCKHGLCHNNSKNPPRPEIVWVPFPRRNDEKRRLKWLHACQLKDSHLTRINKDYYVCSDHFRDFNFEKGIYCDVPGSPCLRKKWVKCFLSPPVPMHGGLICIAFRQYVCR